MSRARDKAPTADEEGFLARWSRRKQEATSAPELEDGALEAAPPEPDAAAAPGPDEADGPPDDSLDDAALAEKYGLPDPNALQATDDFTPLIQGKAPERLRRIAMRRLWRLKPELANLDGLLEYGEDYTDAATVVANLATDYVVGRGFTPAPDVDDAADEPVEQDEQSADAQEGEAGAEIDESAAAEAEGETETETATDEGGQEAARLDLSPPPQAGALADEALQQPASAGDSLGPGVSSREPFPAEPKSARPRRMRFH